MCITSETCRAKSVIIKKLALNNLHQAGPSKPIYDDAWKHKNQITFYTDGCFFMCVCRCQSICDLSFQLEKELECRNSEVSKLQQSVSDLQVYVQQEREQVLRLYTENDRLQVYLLPDSTL